MDLDLTESAGVKNMETSSQPEAACAEDESATPPRRYRVQWIDGVHVRSSPALDAEIVGTLDYGEVVNTVAVDGGWVQHSAGWTKLMHDSSGLCFMSDADVAGHDCHTYAQQYAAIKPGFAAWAENLEDVHDPPPDE